MSIKILGGLAGGLWLSTISEKELRPTSVILRRKIFDAHQDLSGFIFVDLFAGTGAMGIEAWSRGADEVILVEKHKKIASQIERNLKILYQKYPDLPVLLQRVDAVKWLKDYYTNLLQDLKEKLETSLLQGVILFLDPPYQQTFLYEESILAVGYALREEAGMAAITQIWLEGDQQKARKLDEWRSWLKGTRNGIECSEVKSYKQSSHFMMILRPN